MSQLLERQSKGQEIILSYSPLNSNQLEMDRWGQTFVSQASDGTNLTAMLLAGLTYRAVKLGVLLGTSSWVPLAGKLFAPVLGLASEVTMYRGVNGIFKAPRNHPFDHGKNTELFGRTFFTDYVHFASLKIFGLAAQGHNQFFSHVLQDAGMVAGHHLAYAFDLATKPEGKLLEQLARAELMNWQMKVGMNLAYLGAGRRLQFLERTWQNKIEILSNPLKSYPHMSRHFVFQLSSSGDTQKGTFSYRSFHQYQKDLRNAVPPSELEHIERRINSIPESSGIEKGALFRAHLLEKLIVEALGEASIGVSSQKLIWVSERLEEAYVHLDFSALLYLKARLDAEVTSRFSAAIEGFNQSPAGSGRPLHSLSELPLDFPLSNAIPRDDHLRDFFLRHGVFKADRKVEDTKSLMEDSGKFAKEMFIPAFRNVMSILIVNLPLLGREYPWSIFEHPLETLTEDQRELRFDIESAFKNLREFKRILEAGDSATYQELLKEIIPLIQNTYAQLRPKLLILPAEFRNLYFSDHEMTEMEALFASARSE